MLGPAGAWAQCRAGTQQNSLASKLDERQRRGALLKIGQWIFTRSALGETTLLHSRRFLLWWRPTQRETLLDAERLEILGAVLEAYEAKHHPLDSVKDNECYSTGPHSRVPVVNARAPQKVPLISAAQETFYGSLTATDGFTLSNAARMYKQRAWSN